MLLRIVKMTFQPEAAENFISIFEQRRKLIEAFKGCSAVKLMRDINNPNIFFTYSMWTSESALNSYRSSQFFQNTWAEVKGYFTAKPEAWSVQEVVSDGTD